MGGRSRKSVLKQKIAKYYRERENPLALLALQDEIVRLNQEKLRVFQQNLEYLREVDSQPRMDENVSKLNIRKYTQELTRNLLTEPFTKASILLP